jgi:hypothetical protein
MDLSCMDLFCQIAGRHLFFLVRSAWNRRPSRRSGRAPVDAGGRRLGRRRRVG